MKTLIYTILALIAFAGNSVLGRLALTSTEIDAASFTSIRLLSGALVLALILHVNNSSGFKSSKGSWWAALMLFAYAVSFSYAYISLDTGVGALILFAAVQITMIATGMLRGNKLHWLEALGLLIAFSGFVYLVSPGVEAPSLNGFVLMSLAGVAWGFYSLAGLGAKQPLADTAYNFIRTTPFVLLLLMVTLQQASIPAEGVMLAILSGAVTSGMGYTIWYMALRGLSATQAAVVQLLVPVIAALGGVVFSNESLSLRLYLSALMILGGILLVMMSKK